MTTAGLGYVAWWGYSPALDLINLTGIITFYNVMRLCIAEVLFLINAHQNLCYYLGFDNVVKLKAEHVKQGTDINSI